MTRGRVAVDTSVAVCLLVQTHAAHAAVSHWAAGRELVLSGHAAIETYTVLTRLPGDLRTAPTDASRVIEASFADIVTLSDPATHNVVRRLAQAGIAGGAAYDALVGMAAHRAGLTLATRDARAQATYQAIGAQIELVP